LTRSLSAITLTCLALPGLVIALGLPAIIRFPTFFLLVGIGTVGAATTSSPRFLGRGPTVKPKQQSSFLRRPSTSLSLLSSAGNIEMSDPWSGEAQLASVGLESPTTTPLPGSLLSETQEQATVTCRVAIVGAGAAGLQCAHHLIAARGYSPRDVVILEARGRIGGRIYTTTERRNAASNPQRVVMREGGEAGVSEEVEFAMDHGAAWVHGISVPWGTMPALDDVAKSIQGLDAVPFLNPMMTLLQAQHGDRLYELDPDPAVLNPVFEGNPWTRPRTVLRNKLVLYRDGERVSDSLMEQALVHHFDVMQRVSDYGNDLYRRGDGMETARQSLQDVINHVAPSEPGEAAQSSSESSIVRSVSRFFVHLIECWNGSAADTLQLTEFVRDDPVVDDDSTYAPDGSFRGPHCTVSCGMQTILGPLLRDGVEGIIRLNQPVCRIEESDNQVVLRTRDGITIRADVCVNTMPVGVLANAVETGVLHLSPEKCKAIASTQMGCYKKVMLTFTDVWWPRDPPFLGLVRTNDDEGDAGTASLSSSPLGQYLLIDNLWASRDIPCLEVVLFGVAGEWATGKSDVEIRDAVMEFIEQAAGVTQEQGHDNSVRCVAVHVTRWEEDPYSRGAYSSVAVGASIRHVQELTRPEWGGKLMLAGEACVSEFEGSVHSALMSGLDIANAVHAYLMESKPALTAIPGTTSDADEQNRMLISA
jgi:monoamine oxidase